MLKKKRQNAIKALLLNTQDPFPWHKLLAQMRYSCTLHATVCTAQTELKTPTHTK
ncbi:MAG TPA: hypothetical protein VFF15_02235 [Flavobacteriaceae bacterium]|nr:hypothetical protein [Flavobacteriaceae bacterium]